VPAAEPEPEPSLEPVPAAAPSAAVALEKPASPPGGGETKVPNAGPVDPPSAARIDPALPGPSNLYGIYDPKAPGNLYSDLTWTLANPEASDLSYAILEWENADFSSMVSIFNSLVTYEPTASTAAQDFAAYTSQVMQQGLTVTERQNMIDQIEFNLDILLSIMSDSGQPAVWTLWAQLRAPLAAEYIAPRGTGTYKVTKLNLNRVYIYVVLADYASGDSSSPTNSWGMFAYDWSNTAPAQPGGFIATAYDPGVALEWSRNQEMDLAGYNVYVLRGGVTVKLNSQLITVGTEYFDMVGLLTETFYVEAVNMRGAVSTRASAVPTLAAATIYDADSTAWNYSGSWAREDYLTSEPSGGALLRVGHWGDALADPPLTKASVSLVFIGRRIRVYSARYFMCGSVNFYIDGNLEGTFNLYYNGGYYDGPYGTGTYVPALWQQMSFEITGLSKGGHTLTIEAVGSGGAQGSHFINFEYAESRGP